jgi:UDP-glucose 4-epimerase
MKILVTGGFGYLGSHIADHLDALGHEVTILGRRDHPQTGAWRERFDFLGADVSSARETADVCRGMDAVVHCAALSAAESEADPSAALLVTGHGTRNVLASAAAHCVARFVYLSTFHVYGPPPELITEQTPPRPSSDYALTHLMGETYCRQFAQTAGVPAAVLRLSNGYGAPLFAWADCWTLAANDFCRRAVLDGEIVLKTAGKQSRDFVAIPDIVQAVDLMLGTRPVDSTDTGVPADEANVETAARSAGAADRVWRPGDTYNIGGGAPISIRDLAELTAQAFKEESGREVAVRFAAGAAETEPARDFQYSIARAEALGYWPCAFMKDELKKTMRFVDEHRAELP